MLLQYSQESGPELHIEHNLMRYDVYTTATINHHGLWTMDSLYWRVMAVLYRL